MMSKASAAISGRPFLGTWINDGPSPYKIIISENDSELTVTSEAILKQGEFILSNVHDHTSYLAVSVKNNMLRYVSWFEATRQQTHCTLTTTRNRNRLILNTTYSGTTPVTKVSDPDTEAGLLGTWQPIEDDFWSEYTLSMKKGQIDVKGINRRTKEVYVISNVQLREGCLSFAVETLSDGRTGQLRLVFEHDHSGLDAFMHFTFTNIEHLRRAS